MPDQTASMIEAWTAVFKYAVTSPLGIIGLIVLVAGSVVIALFRSEDNPRTKLYVVTMMFLFFGVLVTVAVYQVQPTVPVTDEMLASASTPAAPRVRSAGSQLSGKVDCGTAWTGWVEPGASVGDPCPSGCARGAELARRFQVVGFPPQPQVKYKFQCWRK
ncbi:MAG: hypothetical protein JXR29_02635 [Methylothermaceae bacterium]|nr:hypothetical protein [Methylothermaceae bacterium]